jgi:hypothetical protein
MGAQIPERIPVPNFLPRPERVAAKLQGKISRLDFIAGLNLDTVKKSFIKGDEPIPLGKCFFVR